MPVSSESFITPFPGQLPVRSLVQNVKRRPDTEGFLFYGGREPISLSGAARTSEVSFIKHSCQSDLQESGGLREWDT